MLIASIVITIILWGSAFVAIRVGLHGFSGSALALFRYLVASIVMLLPYYRLKQRQRVNFKDALQFMVLGVFGFSIYNVALNYGEMTVPAGIASFIAGLMPVSAMVIAIFVLKEKVSRVGWIGVVVSILGLTVIVAGEHAGVAFDWGVVYVFIATMAMAAYTILQKPLLKKFHPIEIVSYGIWAGTVVLLVFTPQLVHQIPTASWQATTAAIYMGVFPGAIGYILWCDAINRCDASKVVLSTYSLPIVATFIAWLVLGEIPALLSLVGGSICLLGAIIAGRS